MITSNDFIIISYIKTRIINATFTFNEYIKSFIFFRNNNVRDVIPFIIYNSSTYILFFYILHFS